MNGCECECVYVCNRRGGLIGDCQNAENEQNYVRVSVRVNVVCANLIVFLAYQNYYRYYTFSLRYFVNVVPFINFTLCSRFVQLCVWLANAHTHLYEEWNGMVFGKWEMPCRFINHAIVPDFSFRFDRTLRHRLVDSEISPKRIGTFFLSQLDQPVITFPNMLFQF